MKNILIISTTEEELLSNVDDGTNRLFINGSEIPSTDWVGTGNYTATVEGHAITIAKIDSLDGNISLAKTGEYTYEMRSPSPTTIVVDDALSTTSKNPVQNKVITGALDDKVSKSGDTMTGGLKINDGGLYAKGRVYGSGDDEGIVVDYASNNLACVTIGNSSGRHGAFYIRDDANPPYIRYKDANNNAFDIWHPAKSGTIALTSDILDIPFFSNALVANTPKEFHFRTINGSLWWTYLVVSTYMGSLAMWLVIPRGSTVFPIATQGNTMSFSFSSSSSETVMTLTSSLKTNVTIIRIGQS